MATNHGDLVHIMATERIHLGQLRRLEGQALCRGKHGFTGGLDELVPVEEGATCYACLAIAEGHSRSERQAS
jgi:hypothetical protein